MKATINTTIMLMMMTIGTLAASAQSAQRGTPHNTDNRKATASVATRSDQQRQTAVRDTRSTANSRSSAQKSHAYQNTNRQKQTEQPKQSATVARSVNQKTSTTNNRNPKSNYREPNKNVHVGKTHLDPKSSGNYSTGHNTNRNSTVVYHKPVRHYNTGYYYPQSHVKVHVHPTTYRNHYKVMYYPAHRDIVWTRKMHNYYIGIYPGYTWRYPVGYRVQTISAFEARHNLGEVARVYGRVYGTWYNRETDDLLLFFGGEFPYQEFTMILPGEVARRYSWKPERYFLGQHVMATGLVTSYEGKPEMIVKKRHQLDVY